MKIIYALMAVPDRGLTFTELKKATELSGPVLSDYLNGYKKIGMILKNAETKRYFIPVGYSRASPYLAETDKQVASTIFQIFMQAAGLVGVEDKETRERAYHEFLSYYLSQLSAFILYVIEKAGKSCFEPPKELFDLKLMRKKPDVAAQKIFRAMQEKMDAFHASLKEYLDHWVVPFIHFLALAYMEIRALHPQITGEVFKEFVEASEKNKSWLNILNELEKSEQKR